MKNGLRNLRIEGSYNPKLNALFAKKWASAADFYINNGSFKIPKTLASDLANIGIKVDLSRSEAEILATYDPNWCEKTQDQAFTESITNSQEIEQNSDQNSSTQAVFNDQQGTSGQSGSASGAVNSSPNQGGIIELTPQVSNPALYNIPPPRPTAGGGRPQVNPGSSFVNNNKPTRPTTAPSGNISLNDIFGGSKPPTPPKTGTTPAQPDPIPPQVFQQNSKWVFLGDSLTVGALGTGEKLVKEVKEKWNADIEVVNLSKVGKRAYQFQKEIGEILKKYPDAGFFPVFLGVNDVFEHSESNQNKLRGWLEKILSAIRDSGKTPILLRMTYRNVNGRDPLAPFNASVYDPLIKKYSPAWFNQSTGKGTVDPHGFLKANPQFMASDGIHMNSQGYKAFRQKVFLDQLMKPVFKSVQPASPTTQTPPTTPPPTPVPEPVPVVTPPVEPNSAGPQIYQEAVRAVGESSSSGPDGGNLACAWFVNRILKRTIGYTVDGDSTSSMETDFQAEIAKGKAVSVSLAEAQPGDIILPPTVWTPTRNTGHVGIIGEDQKIYSNSSRRAQWSQNFTYNSWVEYYQTGKNLEVKIYRILK